MNEKVASSRYLLAALALTSITLAALAPAQAAASRSRTATMAVNDLKLTGSCDLLAECAAFKNTGCAVTKPGDPENGRGTPLSGSWADGIEGSVLDVGGLPSTTLANTTAASVIRAEYKNTAIPVLKYVNFSSSCREIATRQLALNWGVSFPLSVPKGTKWIAGWVLGTVAQGVTWQVTFP